MYNTSCVINLWLHCILISIRVEIWGFLTHCFSRWLQNGSHIWFVKLCCLRMREYIALSITIFILRIQLKLANCFSCNWLFNLIEVWLCRFKSLKAFIFKLGYLFISWLQKCDVNQFIVGNQIMGANAFWTFFFLKTWSGLYCFCLFLFSWYEFACLGSLLWTLVLEALSHFQSLKSRVWFCICHYSFWFCELTHLCVSVLVQFSDTNCLNAYFFCLHYFFIVSHARSIIHSFLLLLF